LSETAFGYSKVSDLLQDQRLQDICEVQLRGHGYVVVMKMPAANRNVISLFQGLHAAWFLISYPAVDVVPRRVELCQPVEMEENLPEKDVPVSLVQVASPTAPSGDGASPTWCLTPSTCLELSQDGYKGIVKNSFIQINRHVETPHLPVSRSMPALSFTDAGMDVLGSEQGSTENNQPELPEEDPLRALLNEAAGGYTPMDGVASRTPCRGILRAVGQKKTAHRVNFCLTEPLHDPEFSPCVTPQTPAVLFPMTPATPLDRSEEAHSRIGFQVDELPDPEGVQLEPMNIPGMDATVSELPTLLTPGCLSEKGYIISNTFLTFKTNPPTPYAQKESRRSRSVGA